MLLEVAEAVGAASEYAKLIGQLLERGLLLDFLIGIPGAKNLCRFWASKIARLGKDASARQGLRIERLRRTISFVVS